MQFLAQPAPVSQEKNARRHPRFQCLAVRDCAAEEAMAVTPKASIAALCHDILVCWPITRRQHAEASVSCDTG